MIQICVAIFLIVFGVCGFDLCLRFRRRIELGNSQRTEQGLRLLAEQAVLYAEEEASASLKNGNKMSSREKLTIAVAYLQSQAKALGFGKVGHAEAASRITATCPVVGGAYSQTGLKVGAFVKGQARNAQFPRG